MKKVYVLGTRHDLQKAERRPQENAAFREFISRTCNSLQIKAIVEEMSREALGKTDESICSHVAHALAIAHLYCDPDEQARKNLAIVPEDDLQIQAWYEDWPPDRLSRAIREEHAKRAHFADREHSDRSIMNSQIGHRERSEATLGVR